MGRIFLTIWFALIFSVCFVYSISNSEPPKLALIVVLTGLAAFFFTILVFIFGKI